jgi:dihydrofolate reductase
MELIVAVYDDWGIGKDGDQPIALSADRKFFRETTKGSTVIVGRKTLAAFPGGRPLPKRVNVVLTRQNVEIPDAVICHSVEEAAQFCKNAERTFVIGGGTVYRQMLPLCHTAYITKVHVTPDSDTYFPNLDEDPSWKLEEILLSGEENGIRYEMCRYRKK